MASDIEVRNRKSGQACLWFRTDAGSALVTNFATSAGGSTRPGRNGGRVIVCFHFHQDVGLIAMKLEQPVCIGEKSVDLGPLHHGGVVRVRHDGAVRAEIVRVPDHAKQGVGLVHTVDAPRGIEDLVPTMFGVGLRKHHQFSVGRIASDSVKVIE